MKVETAAEKEREEKEEEALEEVVGRGGRATGFSRVGREEEGEEAAKEAGEEEEKTGDQWEGGVKKTMLRKGSEQHGQGWTISQSCRAVKGGRRTQRDRQ